MKNKIKPLEWKKLPNSYIADTPFGFYFIRNEKEQSWRLEFRIDTLRIWCKYNFESLEACKENAEKHWIVKMQEALEDE